MPTPIVTPFVGYEFNEAEASIAFVFTELQDMHLQTERSIAASARAKLAMNPNNLMENFGEFEFLRGKIQMIDELLALSQNTKDTVAAQMQSVLNLTTS